MQLEPHNTLNSRKPQAGRQATTRLAGARSLTARPAFTLIEILVVISIITILIGIMVAAFMNRQGPASATRITLAALKAAATEYEVNTGTAAHSGRIDPYGSTVNTNFAAKQYLEPADNPPKATIGDTASGQTDFIEFSIARFCHQLLKYPTTNKMLMSLGQDAIGDSDADTFADVIDGWGTKIIYYNPAEDFDNSTQANFSHAQLFPAARTPYFASAGLDGDWGDYRQLLRQRNGQVLTAVQTTLALAAKDNDYSFDLGN